jgi:hypothetical protein
MTRSEIAAQLRNFISKSTTAEDLSAWARRNSLEVMSLPSQVERDLVDKVLDRCILAEVVGFELSEREAQSLLGEISETPPS